jgi:hypothetical protein
MCKGARLNFFFPRCTSELVFLRSGLRLFFFVGSRNVGFQGPFRRHAALREREKKTGEKIVRFRFSFFIDTLGFFLHFLQPQS